MYWVKVPCSRIWSPLWSVETRDWSIWYRLQWVCNGLGPRRLNFRPQQLLQRVLHLLRNMGSPKLSSGVWPLLIQIRESSDTRWAVRYLEPWWHQYEHKGKVIHKLQTTALSAGHQVLTAQNWFHRICSHSWQGPNQGWKTSDMLLFHLRSRTKIVWGLGKENWNPTGIFKLSVAWIQALDNLTDTKIPTLLQLSRSVLKRSVIWAELQNSDDLLLLARWFWNWLV